MIQMGKLRLREELKISQGNIVGQWQSQDKNPNLQNQGPEACLFPTTKEKGRPKYRTDWFLLSEYITKVLASLSFFLYFQSLILAYFNLNRNNSKGRVGSGELAHGKKWCCPPPLAYPHGD